VGDDFRIFHPHYIELMKGKPAFMPNATAQASGRWVEMSLDWLRKNRRSLILETTMAHPDVVGKTLALFKKQGYRTRITIVATPPALSLVGTVKRYVEQVRQQGQGRWVNPAAHDAAVRQMPITLTTQVRAGLVDSLTVITREGTRLFESDMSATSEEMSEALEAIEIGRSSKTMREQAAEAFKADYAYVNEYVDETNDENVAAVMKR
jgi:hypothetical protein